MRQLKFIPRKKYLHLFFSIWLIKIVSLSSVHAQVKYDIRLVQSSIEVEDAKACFEVQLKSATSESWELAGQNYRLFYDTDKASFLTGKSLLGDKYQPFNLVQEVQNVDASTVDGPLNYEADLGFLNYAIDLRDVTSPATIVPSDDTWLSTAEICFSVNDLTDSLTNFEITWARNEHTNNYATSFVEISVKTGANELTSTVGNSFYDWLLPTSSKEVSVKAKVFLQGAFDKVTGLMKDKLRALNYIPLETIYNTSFFQNSISFKSIFPKREELLNDVLKIEGNDAIVDWIFLELRDKQSVEKVADTRSALIQRDGDIVDLDGKSNVKFSVPTDAYYLVIRHRNHLGIMSETPIDFSKPNSFIDFTNPQTRVYGEHARRVENGIALMWGGNADHDEYLVFQGGGVAIPDADYVFFDVFSHKSNIHHRYNHIIQGYYASDLNMDGEVRYQGGANEIDDLLFFNIFSHPKNTQFFSNFFIAEQVPPRIE
ncbi:MAG: hypothetical protein AB8G86_11310 [Saprospiraceae bacterium]